MGMREEALQRYCAILKMPSLVRSNSSILLDLDFTLRRQFSKTSFRPFQREIIQAALNGHDV